MADIRISAGDLRKIQQVQRDLGKSVKNLDARFLEKLTADVSGKINAGIGHLLKDLERIQDRFGVDQGSRAGQRQALEVAQGATARVAGVAPYLALLSSDPRVRIGILAASALAGAVEGSSKEGVRRRVTAIQDAADDADFVDFMRQRERERELQRRLAAVRGASRHQ